MRSNWFSLLGQRHGRRYTPEDVRDFITARAMRDERFLSVVYFLEQAERDAALAGGGFKMMADGIYYRDMSVSPVMIADAGAVTITTAVCTPAATTNFAFLPANYFKTIGKTVKHTQWGKATTGATPGNYTASFAISNADNTRLKSSAAAAAILNKTDLSYKAEGYCTARTLGTSGSAMIFGHFLPHVGLVASTAQPILIPDSANAAVTFDSTVSTGQGFTFQMARSGSTAETITTQALYVEALN